MKTAVYIRVSTEEQAKEGFSIRAQKERLTNFVNSQDWDIHDYYIEEGVSAKDMVRPELNRMIQDIENGHIEVVLVYRLDRLTRSVRDLYNMLDLFESNGCKFKSATEVYDTTTAMGRLFITLVAALAQWERENLGERVRMGMDRMIEEGKWTGGVAPYGYEYNKEGKTLQINEEEAFVIKKIYQEYINGYGEDRLAKIMNEQGYRTRNGFMWTGKMLRDILRNPIYCGHFRWGGEVHENFVDPIIDQDTYDLAMKVRESRRTVHSRAAGKSSYPFSGILKCSRCGSPMKGHTTHGRIKQDGSRTIFRHYLCTNRECDIKRINEEVVEETFISKIEESLKKYKRIATDEVGNRKQKSPTEKEINHLRSQIKKLQERKRKWQLAYADDAISIDELKQRTKEDRELQEELEEQLEALTESHDDVNPLEMVNVLTDFTRNWYAMNHEEKKVALQIFVDRIVVDSEDRRGTKREMRKAWITELAFK